ncbi:ATP-binding protein [Aeromonas veronii]|uniref:ATP-binding protein n=1 Tax=Aeromonas veronii TaxID=654 RepID=UPI0032EFEB19
MTKIYLLLGALLALPLRAAVLPLPPAAQAYADDIGQLTFCYPSLERPPYLEDQGGLLIDQMTRLARQLPVPLHFKTLPNWPAVEQGLRDGQCDLIPHIGPSVETRSGTVLSRAMLEAESAILYRGDLEHAAFLVSPVWQAGEVLKRLYPHSTQLQLTDADNWYLALFAEKGSAYLGDYLQLRYLMREYPDEGLRLRRLRSDELVVSYRLMMRDIPGLLQLVDTAIRFLPPGSLYRDLGRYLPQSEQDINPLHFTDKEQAWLIGSARTIKMVAAPGLMPYSGINPQGELIGWSDDVLRRVSRQTGLNFELIPTASKEEALAKLRSGEAAMMAGLPESPALGQEFNFTRVIAMSRYALVSRKRAEYQALDSVSGSIVVPKALYDGSQLSLLGPHHWVQVQDLQQGIQAVQDGKADAMLAELYQLQYPMRNNLLADLAIRELPQNLGLSFAIRHDQPRLSGVMEQSLMTINDRQVDELVQRWHRLILNQQEGVSYGLWLTSLLLAMLISGAVIWLIWRSRQQLAQAARERHQAEQALALESKFRESLFQTLPVPVFLRNDRGEIIKRNKRAKQLEARYLADLVLPSPQLQGGEGELALRDQVYSYAQIPLQLGSQTPAGDLIALSDISALRERTRLLRQAERRLRALTNTVPGVVLQFTLKEGAIGRVEFVSRGSHELLGLASQQIRLNPNETLVRLARQDRREMRAPMLTMLLAGRPFTYLLRYRHPSKGSRWLQFSGRGRRQGEGWRIYGVVQDVTTRVEQEKALQISHEEAQQAVLAKGRFLAAVSHEIRTPMNAMLGLLEWLDQTELSAEQSSVLTHIRQAGNELLGLLNDVLDFSRNETRQLRLSPQPTDLVELCEHVAAVHWSKARAKGLQLRLHLDPALPALLELDPHRVQQVLHNLISNAIKFSEQGQVVIWAQRQGDMLCCGVDDEGPGISAELLPRLFLPFEQGEEPGQLRAQGTGLGLAICHQLMEQMGGDIDVEPLSAGGSRFRCRFPLHALQERAPWKPSVDTVYLQLMGEDGDYMRTWLQELGVRESPAGEPLSAVRDEQGLQHWFWQEEPWIPGTVVTLLQPRLSQHQAVPGTLPGAGMRVLLVEDHEVNRVLISMQLSQLGARVLSAANGRLALDLLQEETVDLVLTDLQMPVMDGAELCQQLRGSERWQHLPVYVITADLSEQAAQLLTSCGCHGHLDKPVLLRELATLLRTVSGREGFTSQEREEPTPAWVQQGLVPLSPELATLYLTSTRQDLADIERCVTQGDIAALETALHKMKGAAKMVGAMPLVQVIDAWQKAPDKPLVEPLTRAVDDVCRQLSKRA